MAGEPILIVEDSPTNRKLAVLLLAAEGYEVRTAADAEEALVVLETYSPRLILMDVQLPGMDGLTLTRQLKADARTCRILILALTASDSLRDEQEALAAGCDGYIRKPFDTYALPRLVAGHLGF